MKTWSIKTLCSQSLSSRHLQPYSHCSSSGCLPKYPNDFWQLIIYKFWITVADPRFPRGGANPRGDANLLFGQCFPKTASKWINFGPGGGRPSRPLDPLLDYIFTFQCHSDISRVSTTSGNQGKLEGIIPVREKSGNLAFFSKNGKIREFWWHNIFFIFLWHNIFSWL